MRLPYREIVDFVVFIQSSLLVCRQIWSELWYTWTSRAQTSDWIDFCCNCFTGNVWYALNHVLIALVAVVWSCLNFDQLFAVQSMDAVEHMWKSGFSCMIQRQRLQKQPSPQLLRKSIFNSHLFVAPYEKIKCTQKRRIMHVHMARSPQTAMRISFEFWCREFSWNVHLPRRWHSCRTSATDLWQFDRTFYHIPTQPISFGRSSKRCVYDAVNWRASIANAKVASRLVSIRLEVQFLMHIHWRCHFFTTAVFCTRFFGTVVKMSIAAGNSFDWRRQF